MFRQIVLPAFVAVWGLLIVVSRLISGAVQGPPGYESGQNAAFVFGTLMALAGAIYLVRGLKSRRRT